MRVCAHVCFRTYNISVFRGLKVLTGARSRVTTYLSHLFVFEVQTHVYVIMCTDVLYVQVCVCGYRKGQYVRSYKMVAVGNTRTCSWYGASEVRVINRLTHGSNS